MTADPQQEALSGNAPSHERAATPLNLADAILVVAHPDDEILWFSSVVSYVRKVIIVFAEDPRVPCLGKNRERIIEAYPLDNVELLGLTESCAFNTARWPNARRSTYGLELNAPLPTRNDYRRNYELLVPLLDQALANAPVVLTHSPWGDYGHEDHVQVYAAVREVQRKHNFQIWYPGYVSDRSWPMMQELVLGFSHTYATIDTNRKLAHDLAAMYREYNCWTWYDDYIWPIQETLFLEPNYVRRTTSTSVGGNFPVNVLRLGLRQRPLQSRMLSRILKRLGKR